MFHMRPAPGYADFRTPIAGLYQASSATHGGGGVTGIPGLHATRQIMRDRSRAPVASWVGALPRSAALAIVGSHRACCGVRDARRCAAVAGHGRDARRDRFARSANRRQRGRATRRGTCSTRRSRRSTRRHSNPRPAWRRAGRREARKRLDLHRPQGLTWSDGKPVTAADVVYSLEHARDEDWPYAGGSFVGLQAHASDERTVKVTSNAGSGPGAAVARRAGSTCSRRERHRCRRREARCDRRHLARRVGKRRLRAARLRWRGRGPAVQQIVFRTYPTPTR